MSNLTPPDNPAGPYSAPGEYDPLQKNQLIEAMGRTPVNLTRAVDGLSNAQLDTKYRNWTIRQIVHHVADSHVNSYMRFKWTLAEDNPTIKAYEEADWVELADSKSGDVLPSLQLLAGLHARWVQTLESMTAEQFARTFVHPQTDDTVSLWEALNYYPWHARHHAEQIVWLRNQHGWN